MLKSKVTINPASHCAGTCLHNGEADVNVICRTLLRISRLPMADQIRMGQTHAMDSRRWTYNAGDDESASNGIPPPTLTFKQKF